MRSVKKRRPIPRCESSTRYITVSLKGASTFSGYTSFWNTFIIKPFHYRDSLTQGSMSVKFPNAVETSTQIFVVFESSGCSYSGLLQREIYDKDLRLCFEKFFGDETVRSPDFPHCSFDKTCEMVCSNMFPRLCIEE